MPNSPVRYIAVLPSFKKTLKRQLLLRRSMATTSPTLREGGQDLMMYVFHASPPRMQQPGYTHQGPRYPAQLPQAPQILVQVETLRKPKKKAYRASHACKNCRRLKCKCDERNPCYNCRQKGYDCEYNGLPLHRKDAIQKDLEISRNTVDANQTFTKKEPGYLGEQVRRLQKNRKSESETVPHDKPSALRRQPKACDDHALIAAIKPAQHVAIHVPPLHQNCIAPSELRPPPFINGNSHRGSLYRHAATRERHQVQTLMNPEVNYPDSPPNSHFQEMEVSSYAQRFKSDILGMYPILTFEEVDRRIGTFLQEELHQATSPHIVPSGRSIQSVLALSTLALGGLCLYRDTMPIVADGRDAGAKVTEMPGYRYFKMAADAIAVSEHTADGLFTWFFLSLYQWLLGRVDESWAYIDNASRILLRHFHPFLQCPNEGLRAPEYNQLSLVFWACFELESEILAQMPFCQGKLHDHEACLPLPRKTAATACARSVMQKYWAYLYLRIQSRAVSRLSLQTEPLGQFVTDVQPFLEPLLWIPTGLKLEYSSGDDDPLDARLRAEYWGIQVEIHQPFISFCLDPNASLEGYPNDSPPSAFLNFVDQLEITVPRGIRRDTFLRCIFYAHRGIHAIVERARVVHSLHFGHRLLIANVSTLVEEEYKSIYLLHQCDRDPVLSKFIDSASLAQLSNRTIELMRRSDSLNLHDMMAIVEGAQIRAETATHKNGHGQHWN